MNPGPSGSKLARSIALGCNQDRHFRMSIGTCLHTEKAKNKNLPRATHLAAGPRQGCGEGRQGLSGRQQGAAVESKEVCLEVRMSCKKRPGGGPEARAGEVAGGCEGRAALFAARAPRPRATGQTQEAATVNWSDLGFRSHCFLSGSFLLQGGPAFPSLSDLTSPRCRAELIGADRGQRPPS